MLGKGSLCLCLDVQKQARHLLRPILDVLVHDELEFTEVMSVAQAMLTIEAETGSPVVVDSPAAELTQDTDGAHGLLPSFGMDGVADGEGMKLNVIGLLYLGQRMAFVSLLATTAASGLLTQTARTRLLQAIAAGRPAAGAAALDQLVLERLADNSLFRDSLFQRVPLFLQRLGDDDEDLFVQIGRMFAVQIKRWCHDGEKYQGNVSSTFDFR